MGLFDNLKKLGEDLSKEVEKTVGSDTFKNLKNVVENASNEMLSNQNTQNTQNKQTLKEIPEEYSKFPRFRNNYYKIFTKEKEKYIRCTMKFDNVNDEEFNAYISKVNSFGYEKKSEVRFEKDNTYIIIDRMGCYLTLVFHIKR